MNKLLLVLPTLALGNILGDARNRCFHLPDYPQVPVRWHPIEQTENGLSQVKRQPVNIQLLKRKNKAALFHSPTFALQLVVLTVMVVGASGTMLYELSLKRHMEQIETNKLRQLYPESPWRWSKRWQSNRIEYSDKGEMIFSYFLAATIIAVIPLSFLLNPEAALRRFYENRMDSLVILSMLVLAVIFSVRFAVNATYAWRKFKRSTSIMSTFPAVIGGTLEGEIQTMCNLVPYEGFDLKLSCVELDITFQQSFHSITETVLWESQKKVRIEDIRMGLRGISFPVSFTIPLNTDETNTTSREFEGTTISSFDIDKTIMTTAKQMGYDTVAYAYEVYNTKRARIRSGELKIMKKNGKRSTTDAALLIDSDSKETEEGWDEAKVDQQLMEEAGF